MIFRETIDEVYRKHDQFAEDFPCEIESDVEIIYSDSSLNDWRVLPRRPVYFIRGRPISRATALEIIRITDSYIYRSGSCEVQVQKLLLSKGIRYIKSRYGSVLENSWFNTAGAHGWCHPDGYIGTNNYCQITNPSIFSFLSEFIELGSLLKELDLILAITTGNEMLDRTEPVTDQIQTGLRVKNGSIEILGRTKARILINQYDAMYGDNQLHKGVEIADYYNLENISEKAPVLYPQYWYAHKHRVSKNNRNYYRKIDLTDENSIVSLKLMSDFIDRWIADGGIEDPLWTNRRGGA